MEKKILICNSPEYQRLHYWVRKNKPKPELCEICNLKPPREVANISGEYKRDIDDFRWLCSQCHADTDLIRKKKLLGNKSRLGKHHTAETRAKISEIHTGMKHSDETKQKISEVTKGRILTEETRNKMSIAQQGNTHGFQKGNSMRVGKHPTDEDRKKQSDAQRGKVRGVYKKRKIS